MKISYRIGETFLLYATSIGVRPYSVVVPFALLSIAQVSDRQETVHSLVYTL